MELEPEANRHPQNVVVPVAAGRLTTTLGFDSQVDFFENLSAVGFRASVRVRRAPELIPCSANYIQSVAAPKPMSFATSAAGEGHRTDCKSLCRRHSFPFFIRKAPSASRLIVLPADRFLRSASPRSSRGCHYDIVLHARNGGYLVSVVVERGAARH